MDNNISTITQEPIFRCAIYKRSASTEVRSTTLEEQEWNCRDAIVSLGMVVEEQFVVSEVGMSGPSLHREGLNSLLVAAKQNSRPFEYIIMNGTSRMGRSDGVVFEIYQKLEDHGVNLYFATQKLDSKDNNFELLMTFVDMVNEKYAAAHSRVVIPGTEVD